MFRLHRPAGSQALFLQDETACPYAFISRALTLAFTDRHVAPSIIINSCITSNSYVSCLLNSLKHLDNHVHKNGLPIGTYRQALDLCMLLQRENMLSVHSTPKSSTVSFEDHC